MSRTFDIAVVGATGVVGEAMLDILDQRDFPFGKVYALEAEGAAGATVNFGHRELEVGDLATFDFSKVQLGLFSSGADVAAVYAPKAAAAGCVVIDNSAQFRLDPEVPLVVPEVNPQALAQYRQRGIVANPNGATIQMLVALKPIHDAAGIVRINVATYQAVSGAGKGAVEELGRQTADMLSFRPVKSQVFSRQIAFNVIPQIDAFEDNGYTKEEMQMLWETRKILGDEAIGVNATAVWVPVFYGHSAAIHLETHRKLGAAEARALLQQAPGVVVIDELRDGGYPTAVSDASGQDAVYVGRIREDLSHPLGLDLWIVSDNLRKGAALNAVQIAERLVAEYF